ncbi:IS110 family transposase [Bacteroides zoogleoformans]|uniref:Transposase IS110-like N-terminal domain-containing protein n=1 Tax=Bacteroides zoogleoformans TaxID=28119 RepID=A0ABM6TAE6_9BACE|nr:transposase [Bacteroides zoogleoformans]AVM53639.1 hypothetical protein C4H11_12585 [Bacteroides zoogleoformans]
MAKKAKKKKTGKGLKLKVVNPNACGIDVSSTEMQVCVPEDRDGDNNRCFGTFIEDLYLIADWLKSCGIDTVAMESTGVYRVQLYMILEDSGFDVLLVNAKAIKTSVRRKWMRWMPSGSCSDIVTVYLKLTWVRRIISVYKFGAYRNLL